jgi:hypothetical protein
MGQMCYMPPNRTLPAQQSALVNHIKKGAPLENTHVADLKLAGGGHSAKASNKSERRKRRKSYSSNKVLPCFLDYIILAFRSLSCILTFPKNKAAVGPVEGGAHHECFKHFGDNDNGVNVSYAGEQNFQNGNISFG